jgi:hypothetical protein
MKQIVLGLTIAIIVVVAIFAVIVSGITSQVDNQSEMLCYSAKQSGNSDYLAKCSVYYQTGNVRDIRE